jgi:hypothetical protein
MQQPSLHLGKVMSNRKEIHEGKKTTHEIDNPLVTVKYHLLSNITLTFFTLNSFYNILEPTCDAFVPLVTTNYERTVDFTIVQQAMQQSSLHLSKVMSNSKEIIHRCI